LKGIRAYIRWIADALMDPLAQALLSARLFAPRVQILKALPQISAATTKGWQGFLGPI